VAAPLDLDGPDEPPPAPAPAAPNLELGPVVDGVPVDGEEEDGVPYDLRDKLPPTCPKCHKDMSEGAVVCLACGFNQRARRKIVREYQPLARSWETNMRLGPRLVWWLMVLLAALAAGVPLVIHYGYSVPGFLACWVFFSLNLAFLFGTYAKVDLVRDAQGRVTLTITWRYCFVKAAARHHEVRHYVGVVCGEWDASGVWEWVVLACLVPFGLIPAAAWWYYVIHSNVCQVALVREHATPALYVYRGRRPEQMRDVAESLCNATGLKDMT
jgi:hypothetical protein